MAVVESRYSEAFISPMTDFGITVGFNLSTHTGLDFGWNTNPYAPIYPIQSGKVVDVFSSSSCGYACVVQHDYSDGKKRYSAYLHMKQAASVKVGQEVFPLTSSTPTILGYRGSTGQSSGPHLHLYVTDKTTSAYSWNLISHGSSSHICRTNPLPKIYKTNKISTWLGTDAKKLPVFEDTKFMAYPTAVTRNEYVAQVEIKGATQLMMRKGPTKVTDNTYDEYAPNGIFNLLDKKTADGYVWIKIAEIDGNQFWVAKLSYVTELPIINVPKPVTRNEKVKQCEVLIETLILRKTPGGEDYTPYATKGIYNVLAEQAQGNYTWYQIGEDGTNKFWVASGGTRTKDLDVVKEEPKAEPVHTHSYGEWKTIKAATCTEKGQQKRTCSCGEAETKEIAALGHTYEWVITKEATVSAEGEKAYKCTRCGNISKTEKIAKLEDKSSGSMTPTELNAILAAMDELKTKVANIVIEDATHATKIANLEADNKTKSATIEALNKTIDALNSEVATLSKSDAEVKTELTKLKTDVVKELEEVIAVLKK